MKVYEKESAFRVGSRKKVLEQTDRQAKRERDSERERERESELE